MKIKQIIKKVIAGLIGWSVIQFMMMGDQSGILLTAYYVFLVEIGLLAYFISDKIFNLKTKKGKN